MADTMGDIAWEMAITDLHHETVMERAAAEQAILVLVEGDSEEAALSVLLAEAMDMDAVGVKIANYNGHGNLPSVLRLLRVTLCHDRPVIVTCDNDPASVFSLQKCMRQGLLGGATRVLSIPFGPVVSYKNGHRGGSFEESFPLASFLNAAFSDRVMPPGLMEHRAEFESSLDPGEPWLAQLQKFVRTLGAKTSCVKKTLLAEVLALECDELPDTYARLVSLIHEVRSEHPIEDPNDVELPRVRGLTC